MKLKLLSLILVAAAMTSCGSGSSITGEWVEPVPGMEGVKQGFKLEDGGKASSINMATLRYQTWKQEGDLLILSGESIGNGQTIPFTDTLQIRRQTADSLVLQGKNIERVYTR